MAKGGKMYNAAHVTKRLKAIQRGKRARNVVKHMGGRIMPYKDTVNMGLGFPKKLLVRQKYSETVVLTGVTALGNYVFSLNDLRDPNVTSTGSQPYYFDQYMTIYDHFTVLGAKITVKVKPYASNTVPIKVVLWQDDDATVTSADWNTHAEQSKIGGHCLLNGYEAGKTLSMKWSAKKQFGKGVLSNFDLRGSAGTSPSEQTYAIISYAPGDTVTSSSFILQVNIEYISMYTEMKDIAGS